MSKEEGGWSEAASAITDRGQAIEFSGMVLDSLISRSQPSLYEGLSLFPAGESRLAHLEEIASQRYPSRTLRENAKVLYEELGQLGHSDAEIERITSALEENK